MHLKLTNGQPEKYSIGQLRRDNSNTSFPKSPPEALLADWDVYPYTTTEQPVFDSMTQTLSEGVFEQDEAGNWVLPWVVTNKPLDKAEAAVRRQRDRLLSDTDWVVTKHTEKGTNIPMEWEVYRQALRDITEQEGFPYSVTWPTKP